MIARLTRNIWAIAPKFDYTNDFPKAELLPVKGALVAVTKNKVSSWNGPYRGTLLESPYEGYYATDLDNCHFRKISPLELLAEQLKD